MLIKVEKMEKMASFKLPKDPTKWNQEILRHLFEENEWIDVEHYHLKWSSKFDGERGYGTGIIVLEKENDSVSIPVIVRDFELEPLDMFYYEKKLYPLTPKVLERFLHNTSIAEKVDDRKSGDMAMFDHIFPPHWGRYIHASVNEERILEAMELRGDDIEKMAAAVEKNGAALFKKHAHIVYIEHILGKEPAGDDGLEKVASINQFVVAKDDELGYRAGYTTSDGGYEEVRTGYGGLLKMASEIGMDQSILDGLVEAADRGRIGHLPVQKTAAVTREQLRSIKAGKINDDSTILTRTKSGRQIEGFVIPSTYSFDLNRMTPMKLLIDKHRNILAFKDEMVGVKKGRAPLHQMMHMTRITPVRPGMTVSFMWRNQGSTPLGGSSMALATQPAKVLSIESFPNEGTIYTLLSAFGGRHRVMLLKGNQRPVFRVDNKHQAVYLPERTVVLFGNKDFEELVDTAEEFVRSIEKTAHAYEVIHFKTTGDVMVKVAGREFSGGALQAAARLLASGIPEPIVKEAMEHAMVLGSAVVYADSAPLDGTPMEKTAESFVGGLAEELRGLASADTLVKAAASVDDIDTVDKVLSLNFINRKNLSVFYAMVPKFKEAVSNLAKLLLASRLGKVGVDQPSVSEAMHAMQALIEQMEGLYIEDR